MTRLRRLLTMCAFTAAATVAIPAQPSTAGEYVIDQCSRRTTFEPARVVADWSAAGESRKYVDCSWRGGSFGLELPSAGASLRYGEFAWLRLGVPASLPGVELAGVALDFAIRANTGNLAYFEIYSEGTRYHSEPVPADHSAHPLDLPLSGGVRTVDLALYCSTAHGPTNCSWGSAFEVLRIRGARLRLVEHTPPTATVDGGSLTAGGSRSGRETLTYSASDGASGIERVEVKLGTATVARRDFRADATACPRDSWAACVRARSEVLEVDTTQVPDGAHSLTLVVTDAAGNARSVAGGSVTVANRPPAPATPSAAASPTAPQPGRAEATRIVASFAATGRSSIRARYGSRLRIAGRLSDDEGRPAADAEIEVQSRIALPSTDFAPEAVIRTDQAGAFTYDLAAGPSRVVRLVHRRAAGRTAETTLTAHVAAPLTLSARPVRLRNGRVLTLAGRLPGKPLPVRGVIVDLQVRIDGRWRSFAAIRASSTGRYRHRHRFRHVFRPARFRFRARVRRDSRYPYTTGHSRSVAIRVNP